MPVLLATTLFRTSCGFGWRAATGAPRIALYGPTDPRLWGPWPSSGLSQAWEATETIQNRGNVWLVQNAPSCPFSILPCQQEGCLRRLDSYSECLDELTVSQVLSAVDAALASPAPAKLAASGA